MAKPDGEGRFTFHALVLRQAQDESYWGVIGKIFGRRRAAPPP